MRLLPSRSENCRCGIIYELAAIFVAMQRLGMARHAGMSGDVAADEKKGSAAALPFI
jgi:hypothetical protein